MKPLATCLEASAFALGLAGVGMLSPWLIGAAVVSSLVASWLRDRAYCRDRIAILDREEEAERRGAEAVRREFGE